nr:MAG TPA: hypothetical protein [Caudoviricetes sp.]
MTKNNGGVYPHPLIFFFSMFLEIACFGYIL